MARIEVPKKDAEEIEVVVQESTTTIHTLNWTTSTAGLVWSSQEISFSSSLITAGWQTFHYGEHKIVYIIVP
jgi:hypothetical protein